jgi:hypothetical protein
VVEAYQKDTYLPRFRTGLELVNVPIEERTIRSFMARRPDFVVQSSASRMSITHIWNPDWRDTRELLKPVPGASELLAALESGALGYRPMAVFGQAPRLLRLEITSLAPSITIYGPGRGGEDAYPGIH